MSERQLEVEPREGRGKNASRRLRASGLVPAVIYGGELEAVPIQVDRKKLANLLRLGSGENTIFQLQLAGGKDSRHTMIADLQVDPITHHIIHADFKRISMTERIHVMVPVSLVGEPEGVRNEDGIVDFVTREIQVECLPTAIPEELEIDISALHVGQHVEASQIPLPEGVSLLEDGERVIASVALPRMALEEEVEEEEEGLLEGEADQPERVGEEDANDEESDEG